MVVITGAGLTARANVLLAVAPLTSFTWAVKFEVAAVVGVPVICPVEFSVRPGGKVPVATVHDNGAVPPVAVRVCE